MTSRSAREFRRNNPVLFTDSENSENSDENESENDENENENEAKNPQLKKLPRNFHRKFQITLAKEFLEKAQNNPQIIVGDENGPPAKKVKKIEVFVNFALNVCVPKSVKSVVHISAESILMSYVLNVSQSPLLNSQSA